MAASLSNEVKQALEDIYYNERTGRGREALALLERASAAGDGDATCVLARCYCGRQYVWAGHGFPEDDHKAVRYLHKSVEQGSALGVLVALRSGELYRLLKKGGIFITEQVGSDNDRDLVEMVLPGTEKPFPHLNLKEQKKVFEDAGFHLIRAEEAYRPIKFYDMGAFVWFAHIIAWEFPGFSVDRCFEGLLNMQKIIEAEGCVEGTIHRYLLVAQK